MLTKKEILEISYYELEKHNLKTKVIYLNPKQFHNKSLLSPIIKQTLKEGNTLEELNIPALISHEKNTIYLSPNTINKLLKNEPISIQTRFIKSIILHEIQHFLNKKHFNKPDFNTSLRLEEEASRQFKKNYPALAALGRRICKKYISS